MKYKINTCRSSASKTTVLLKPADTKRCAQLNPAMPAPITIIDTSFFPGTPSSGPTDPVEISGTQG